MTDTPTKAPHPGVSRMPTWFIPHGGGPCFFMDWDPPGVWDRMETFLREAAQALPERPKAILMVSAHWVTPQFRVSAGQRPDLIYDYYGFPPHTYTLQYPAPGEPALAARVAGLLRGAGMPCDLDEQRGFDHGMFIPLMLTFPKADIPVVQLSLLNDMDPAAHVRAGQALAPLRDEGVLIVGSGMSFHNLHGRGDPRLVPVADAFDEWLTQAALAPEAERNEQLSAWESAPYARLCHPPRGEEHLIPLMVAAGAAGADTGRKVYFERLLGRAQSAFSFGS